MWNNRQWELDTEKNASTQIRIVKRPDAMFLEAHQYDSTGLLTTITALMEDKDGCELRDWFLHVYGMPTEKPSLWRKAINFLSELPPYK